MYLPKRKLDFGNPLRCADRSPDIFAERSVWKFVINWRSFVVEENECQEGGDTYWGNVQCFKLAFMVDTSVMKVWNIRL